MKMTLFLLMFITITLKAQTTSSLIYARKQWTEDDRKFLLDNLVRSRDELIKETQGLSKEQWAFKESPKRWSINQVVEHIAIWELLIEHEIHRALESGLKPDLYKTASPDSVFLNFIMEEKAHITTDYTKPYTYTVPSGSNEGINNLAWFLKMRNESIDFLRATEDDLRGFNLCEGSPAVHQRYIIIFGHCDRHLRQIRKIKQHPNYPKSYSQ